MSTENIICSDPSATKPAIDSLYLYGFTTELRSAGNGTYLLWDPPLVGMQVKLDQDAAGQPTWQLISEDPDQPGTYTFTPAPPTAAGGGRPSTARCA